MAIGSSRPLGVLLRRVYDAFVDEVYGTLAEGKFGDIRPSHGAVLRNLDPEGTRVSVLALRAGMTKQSMTYLVEDLAALGYVGFRPDRTDGRARLVVLSTRGRAVWREMVRLSREVERTFARSLSQSELTALRDILARLVASLDR